eukprot:jgi/Undpi1/6671/HiC_scaffold_20.g09150.m1
MRFTGVLLAVGSAFCFVRDGQSKKCGGGEDLGNHEKIRIGVLHRPKDCNRKSTFGDRLSMHYTGLLFKNCNEFDSSASRGPFSFTLGQGEVIQGWDTGLLNMCEGERRRLTIPSEFGYGSRGAGGDIPGGATLVFDVQLLKIN